MAMAMSVFLAGLQMRGIRGSLLANKDTHRPLRCSSSGGDQDTASSSSYASFDWDSEAPSAKEQRRLIRKELARKVMTEVVKNMEEVDYPLWMDDEGDPEWNDDEPDDGWGFDVSKFFEKPAAKNSTKNKQDRRNSSTSSAAATLESDGSDSEADYDAWDLEDKFQWMVWEISQSEWHDVVFEDKRPLLVLVYERYGPRSNACFQTLKELEKAVKTFYDKKKIALRAARIDAQRDRDMVAALKLDSFPALLVIRESKLLHRIYGSRTEDEILQATAHFFHGARRPAFLGTGLTTVEAVPECKPSKKKESKVNKALE
ncbi:thioredoxin-like fold domain-containing protein MRL7L, chloroplastic [Selaginella moellendorffii]|uniref:thioredoxin-like fold domain-containing protein MRL7L, chloroplastic n=1 Tax=Selaginella moellendorffii TaxID=88036 RepID=UPI000D1C5615|nr:thioredoxin-like fold domain-containing protein MRL7L, chloroplastic [Selaginella moellendorffii]|eukprot:XP_024519702.1 thioredoxin-like fold domain-containing protein MRL7L, chloroplastic [Selaginella moellendorffii]